MKNLQENLATLNIWSRNVTTSTREPTTRAWISADIWRQDGAICSKNRKIVPYHGFARIPRLAVSVPDYGSCLFLMIFPCMSLHCKLVPVHYREYEYGLLLIAVLTETCRENYGSGVTMTVWRMLILDLSWTEHLDSIGNSCMLACWWSIAIGSREISEFS